MTSSGETTSEENPSPLLLIGEKLYTECPESKNLIPVHMCEHILVYTEGYAAVVDKYTNTTICKIALAHRLSEGFSKPTKAQLEDADRMVRGEIKPPLKRAKKVVVNHYWKELLTYQQLNLSLFRECVHLTTANKEVLRNPQNGKINFNFNDLCRILVTHEFTSDDLFSDERGNEYTMRAYRESLEDVVRLCRNQFNKISVSLSGD